MAYWRMNTDKDARNDARTCDLWYKYGMAFAGDHQGKEKRHASIFKKLSPEDGIFMHVSGLGVVGFGIVQELWDKQAYKPQDSLVYNIGAPKEIYEYRIRVNWLPEYDRRKNPLNINKLIPHMGTFNEIDENTYDVQGVLAKLCNNSAPKPLQESVINDAEVLYEGASKEIIAKFYERNPGAREKCLVHWGFDCCICGFNFEVYGSLGKDYIHVHHIVPISSYDNEHPIDPVKDLCPVCPNCHVMLHRKSPPYTIEELRDYYKES